MENNIKDGQKKLIQDFNALGWLQIIFVVLLVLVAIFAKDSVVLATTVLFIFVKLLVAFLMFKGKKYALEGNKTAHTYGIITGILLILCFDLLDIILGILILVDSSSYNKAISEK